MAFLSLIKQSENEMIFAEPHLEEWKQRMEQDHLDNVIRVRNVMLRKLTLLHIYLLSPIFSGLEAQQNKAKVRIASLPKQWQPKRAYLVCWRWKQPGTGEPGRLSPALQPVLEESVAAKSSYTGTWRLTNARSFWDRRMGIDPGLTRQTSTQGWMYFARGKQWAHWPISLVSF